MTKKRSGFLGMSEEYKKVFWNRLFVLFHMFMFSALALVGIILVSPSSVGMLKEIGTNLNSLVFFSVCYILADLHLNGGKEWK